MSEQSERAGRARPGPARLLAGLAVLLLLAPAGAAQPGIPGGGVNNWAEFRAALAACWAIPAGSDGALIAFRFGLDKTGAIRGTPLVTARQAGRSRQAWKGYETAARDALSRCFPMPVTPAFGAVLGESPIRLRFVNTPPTGAYQINSNITLFAPAAEADRPPPPRR
ncbi:hypothetical protein OPKNFCMD_3654 [Methylobacterium crusticola]|uniref:TonB C-terminal domain-containing protein n=1 Tax=Methylobacterium crusticola TaxID=1697972 RepID=A0ABQ4R1R6_9HYPH|nr:hypothetical protein [Methylobacterium crusticola]GJD50905.1 hypothetical protein OPKNFCMD_3654 [Methylobacterium crusticola]